MKTHYNPPFVEFETAPEETANPSWWSSTAEKLKNLPLAWVNWRHQRAHARIEKAIDSYVFEKHCLSSNFKPAASESTMRMALGKTVRDRFPFHVQKPGKEAVEIEDKEDLEKTTPMYSLPVITRNIRPTHFDLEPSAS
ncbi:MAG: hypothetical protein AAF514_00715 [Verrucomicrobiota bacterium]